MKLSDTVQELFGSDPRGRGFGKGFTEASDTSAQFEGVLLELGSGVDASDVAASPSTTTSLLTRIDLKQTDLSAAGASVVLSADDHLGGANARKGRHEGKGTNVADGATNAAAPGATQSVESSGELVTMILSNASQPKTSVIRTLGSAPGPAIFTEQAELASSQPEAVTTKSRKSDGDDTSTSTGGDPQSTQGVKSPASSHELMAMLLDGLSSPKVPVQDAVRETVVQNTGPAAIQIKALAEPDRPSALERPSTDIQASRKTVDLAGTPVAPSISTVSVSTHLAVSDDRKASSAVLDPGGLPEAAGAGTASVIEKSNVTRRASESPDPSSNEQVLTTSVFSQKNRAAAQSAAPTLAPITTGGAAAGRDGSFSSRTTPPDKSRLESSPRSVVLQEQATIKESPDSESQAQSKRDTRDGLSIQDPPFATGFPSIPEGSVPVAKIAAAVASLAESKVRSPSATPTASLMPARTLTLRLEQADLGPIDIRMHVSGAMLDLHLAVADRDTLTILRRDREALTSAIEDRQYQVHSLVIQDSSAAPTNSANHTSLSDAGTSARAGTDSQGSAHQRGDRNNGHRESSRSRQDDSLESRSPDGNPRRSSFFV